MANYKGRAVRRIRDEWYFYDQLPPMLKLRLAAATKPWSCAQVLDRYRKYKSKNGRAAALSYMIDCFDNWDNYQTFNTCWEKDKVCKNNVPTPCKVAQVKPLITNY